MEQVSKHVYLMRGLPACGKSHMARRLAGPSGLVLETDQYFYTQVGSDPARYDYSDDLLPKARAWNLERFQQAIAQEVSPIVVDRGNGLNPETRAYAVHAIQRGYRVDLAKPDSEWWQELKVLLKYRPHVNGEVFDIWARRLADSTRDSHRVPSATIRRWMNSWKYDLTVDDIVKDG